MTTSSNRFALLRKPSGGRPRNFTPYDTTLAGAALRRIGQFFQLVCYSAVKTLKSCRCFGNLTRHAGKSFVSSDKLGCLHRVSGVPSKSSLVVKPL